MLRSSVDYVAIITVITSQIKYNVKKLSIEGSLIASILAKNMSNKSERGAGSVAISSPLYSPGRLEDIIFSTRPGYKAKIRMKATSNSISCFSLFLVFITLLQF